MGARSEAFAKQFERKAQEAAALIEKLSDADWKKVTDGERWPVGVTAHHAAEALEPIANMLTAVASGQSHDTFTMAMLDEMNAQHAKEHANCTKAETLALLQQGTATAAAVVRGLSDEQLTTSGTISTDWPPMTVEQLITVGLIGHADDHFASIRRTVGV
jgi:hypothetical protein